MKKAVIFDYYGVLVNHGQVNDLLVAAIRELKAKGLKLFLISNADQALAAEHPQEFPARDELFDKCYYSWQTGFMKDDPRAFEPILKENNLKPDECVYFDDSKKNIEVAQSLGIESYLFEGPAQVLSKLQ